MKKMEAICTANNAVDKPVGRTGHWEVFGPARATDPDGDWTSLVRPTYTEALSARKEWVARIALALMGYEREAIEEAFGGSAMGCRIEVIVSAEAEFVGELAAGAHRPNAPRGIDRRLLPTLDTSLRPSLKMLLPGG